MKTSIYKIKHFKIYYYKVYPSIPSISWVFKNYDVSRNEDLLDERFDGFWWGKRVRIRVQFLKYGNTNHRFTAV